MKISLRILITVLVRFSSAQKSFQFPSLGLSELILNSQRERKSWKSVGVPYLLFPIFIWFLNVRVIYFCLLSSKRKMRIKLYAERRVLLHALGRQSGGWNNVQYWHVWYLCGWKMWGMLMGNKFAMVCLNFGSVSQRRTTPEAIEPKLIPVWVTRRTAALLEKWCKSIEGFKCNHQNSAGKIRCHPIILVRVEITAEFKCVAQ